MKKLAVFMVLIFCGKIVLSQETASPKTYAIVIGVAKYLYPDIPQLQFANRDATAFSDYLMSASGGSVPRQQIRLLTDSAATNGEVGKALRWVLNACKENDLVYFYFSGHGEMENYTINKNGYLICYNTPSVAFEMMGLSIDYLNDVVNTLSAKTKAKVIVITDACHSGKMNEKKFKGNFFVGEQLMLKKQNEIRMASSKPDQLSNEKTDWGGGRGVFSYYLLNGLQGGMADADNDKTVNVGELKNYLLNKMANDPVLINEGDVQTPVIDGDAGFKIANVIEAEAKTIIEQAKNDSVNITMAINALALVNDDDEAEPDMYFFNLFKKQKLESLTDSLRLNKLTADEIAFTLISFIKKNTESEKGLQKLNELEADLRKDKEMLGRFNVDLSGYFIDIGQAVITNYIKGDEAELERRRYYNSDKNDYDLYVRIFEAAFELSKSDRYYHTNATFFLHYFTGLVLRLKIPVTVKPEPLIEQALIEQKKALALVENASYIYNELGVLYDYKNDLAKAEQYFLKATELSPGWAIPVSNVSSLYIDKKNYQKAKLYADRADRLQKGLQSTCINRGIIHEKTGNLLYAEEEYRKAIDINSRHFLPFEKLGYLYLSTTDYAMADSFFYEAGLRKKGYHFQENGPTGIKDKQSLTPSPIPGCTFADTLKFKPDDMLAWFAWGVAELYGLPTVWPALDPDGVGKPVPKNNAGAIQKFRKVISLGKHNPLVYHYLGIAYYEQQQWEEAELMLRYAMAGYMSREAFSKYLDSVKKSAVYPYDHDCYEMLFSRYYYNRADNHYFLASLYEKWSQPAEAEVYYKKIIESGSGELVVYMKLWQLLEKQGLYLQAENILKRCENYYPDTIYRELNAFYRRAIEKEPGTADWYYKLGLLLYNRANEPSKLKISDTILWYPKVNMERFVPEFNWKTKLDESGRMVVNNEISNWEDYLMDIGPGTSDKYIPEDDFDPSSGEITVPGTGEILSLADEVMFPRFDGTLYLKRAAELISERETLASINYKIAEIYAWAGSKKMALPFFEKSFELDQENVNTRIKLVDIYTALYKNRAALKQLAYLNDSNQINFDKRLQFAKFSIHAGNFNKANELLRKADSIHPYVLPEIYNLRGLSNMLTNKPDKAIEAYEKSIAAQQADPWFNHYSIARIYAKAANTTQAWKYLNRAVAQGFNYSYVLQNDSFMESLHKTPKWQTFINGITMKDYKKNKPLN
jgi:tetratricopeptide (TPR) repeat protein